MIYIDSYNSMYPAEYYKVGVCYSFYKNAYMTSNRDYGSTPYVQELIKKYSPQLEKCYKQNRSLVKEGRSVWQDNIAHTDGDAHVGIDRAIGVVVAKGKAPGDSNDRLWVLFQDESEICFITPYTLGRPAFLNDKEYVEPGTKVNDPIPHDPLKVYPPANNNIPGPILVDDKKIGPIPAYIEKRDGSVSADNELSDGPIPIDDEENGPIPVDNE